MRHKFLRRARERAGFTLAETMIAVLIMLMVSSLVAGGIPLAMNAYHDVLTAANAETLLSTAVICLRDELSEATRITVGEDHSTITYTSANGTESVLYLAGAGKGIMLREHVNEEQYHTRALVSEGASDQDLYLDYGGSYGAAVTYREGVIVIDHLSVKSGTRVLASLNKLKIRVLADVVT